MNLYNSQKKHRRIAAPWVYCNGNPILTVMDSQRVAVIRFLIRRSVNTVKMITKNELQVFNQEGLGSLRTITDETGEAWFCLADLCKSLGLNQPSRVKERLEEDGCITLDLSTLNKNKGADYQLIGGQNPQRTFINEPNLYECICRSNRPEAKKFKKWVFSEVLPSIRKTGGYMVASPNETPEQLMARALRVADATIERLTAEAQAAEKAIEEKETENKELQQANSLQAREIEQKDEVIVRNKPKVDYYNMAMESDTTYTTNQIALELGTTAIRLNARLQADGIQYCQNGCWVLMAKYRDRGLTSIRTWEVRNDQGEVTKRKPMMRWTEAGRKFLLDHYTQAKKEDGTLFSNITIKRQA